MRKIAALFALALTLATAAGANAGVSAHGFHPVPAGHRSLADGH